jgi:hypothetical protein
MSKKERRFWFCVIFVIAVFIFWRAFELWRASEEAKPYITYTRVMATADECDEYKVKNGRFPDSMDALHSFRVDLNDPWTQDGWGRELILIPFDDSLGYGRIVSYGRDGKVGGTGSDRDFEIRFPYGSYEDWNKKLGEGLKRPPRR